jgi:hypothetical protein
VVTPRPAPPPAAASLLDDLEAFSRRHDEEMAAEKKRLEAEQREEQKRQDEARRRAAEEARRAEEEQRQRATASGSARRPGALDMLRQHAPAPPPEDPATQRARAMDSLDRALRAANRFFGEFAAQVSSVRPASARPYVFQFVGAVPVVLSDAGTDARPRIIGNRDYLDYALLRFNAWAQPPAKIVITGDDVARLEAYLKGIKAAYEMQATARHDFGHVTRAIFTVRGPFPCEAVLRADYDKNEVALELSSVRRMGKAVCRVPAAEIEQAADDLGRYILGADDDFERRLPPRRP